MSEQVQCVIELEQCQEEYQEQTLEQELLEENRLLRKHSSSLYYKIREIQDEMSAVEKQIDENQQKLLVLCDHDWQTEIQIYSSTTWHCRKCGCDSFTNPRK